MKVPPEGTGLPSEHTGAPLPRQSVPDGNLGRTASEAVAMTKCVLYMAPIALIELMATEASAVPAVWSGSMARNIAVATAGAKDAPLVLVRGGFRGGSGGGGFRGGGGGYRGGAAGRGSWAGAGANVNRGNFGAPTSTAGTLAAPTSTAGTLAAPTSTVGTLAAPTSTAETLAAPTSTVGTSTAPTSTETSTSTGTSMSAAAATTGAAIMGRVGVALPLVSPRAP
jgi:hypothetical protein